jgi:hypothetical protein
MAFENEVMDVSFLVTADLSAYQYHLVKLSADNTVTVCTHADNDNPIGVLQNKPTASGEVARVRVMGISRVIVGAGGAIAFSELIGTDANGEAVTKTLDKAKYIGVCVDGAGVGETGTILMAGPRKTISV